MKMSEKCEKEGDSNFRKFLLIKIPKLDEAVDKLFEKFESLNQKTTLDTFVEGITEEDVDDYLDEEYQYILRDIHDDFEIKEEDEDDFYEYIVNEYHDLKRDTVDRIFN